MKLKLKSYTFHYYDKQGKRRKKKYKVDGVMIRNDHDAKNLFYQNHKVEDVIYLTADYT